MSETEKLKPNKIDAHLIIPCEKYIESYYLATLEDKDEKRAPYILHKPENYDEWKNTIFNIFKRQSNGENLQKGFVANTTFWLIDDNEFIGVGNIRHTLNENLCRMGGNIGYYIRSSKRRLGYGSLILKLLTTKAKNLNIEKALITCDEKNTNSKKLIDSSGAVFQDKIVNIIEGKEVTTLRYIIDTSKY